MLKKIIIVTKIFIILFMCQIILINKVNATDYVDDTIKKADKFISEGKDAIKNDKEKELTAKTDDERIKTTSEEIYNTLLVIGIGLSIIVGAVLGIQLMWGSIEQQVKAKEMIMPYVAGCVVIFGAFGIWKLCVTIFSQL